MKSFIGLILLHIGILHGTSGQNYVYIHGKMDPELKAELSDLVENWTEIYDLQNVTIAVMKCYLPRRTQGTTEYAEEKSLKRKMILIRLNVNLNPAQQQEVLAHEMVHAHQLYSGELVRHDRITYTWKGRKYHNIDLIPHRRRPWEVEAITHSRLLLASK